MIVIINTVIVAVTAPITREEEALLPLTHASGAAYWIIDAEHGMG